MVAMGGVHYIEIRGKKKARGHLRNRHVTANERLKEFQVLSECFRRNISKHSDCFRACAVLTQLLFGYDKQQFEVTDVLACFGY